MKTLVAFISGLLFAFGLGVSGMSNPWKVRGFLDVGGAWDPSLAFVMASALIVFGAAYQFARRRGRPLLDSSFHLSALTRIDARLVGGSALFGLGWGLSGFCPGPALFAITSGRETALIFVAAFIVSAWTTRRFLAD